MCKRIVLSQSWYGTVLLDRPGFPRAEPGMGSGPRASGMGSIRLLTYAIFSSAFRFRLSGRGFGFMNQSIADTIDFFVASSPLASAGFA